MLDANARHIPKGVKFFVGGYVDKNSVLNTIGVKSCQYYLCKMMDNSNNNPRFSIKVNGKVHVVKHSSDYSFLCYQGMPDGRGFICDESKSECEKIIGEFNSSHWGRV